MRYFLKICYFEKNFNNNDKKKLLKTTQLEQTPSKSYRFKNLLCSVIKIFERIVLKYSKLINLSKFNKLKLILTSQIWF